MCVLGEEDKILSPDKWGLGKRDEKIFLLDRWEKGEREDQTPPPMKWDYGKRKDQIPPSDKQVPERREGVNSCMQIVGREGEGGPHFSI